MLIAHPSSSCDVCLEPFRASVEGSADARLPCAIQCGHVFCKQCINSFTRLICPLCRSSFDPRSIRRLHLDLSNAPLPSPAIPPSSVLFEGSDGTTIRLKEEYKARLIELIREGANASHYHALLGEVTSWLRTQAKDDHWDLRALYMLIIRYREMHAQSQAASADLKSVQEEIARLRAHENNIERRNFELSEALELLEREKAELEEELRECDVSWNEKYDVAMGEIASLREEILFFSAQRSRSHVSPVPSPAARPSGLSISRPPIEDSEDDELPPPPPPPPTQPKVDDSELEGIDAARFSPLGAGSHPSSLPSQGFSPLQEETVLPAEDDAPSKPARRSSDAHSKPPQTKSLAITDVAARFYETIGTAPGASSSLPHPAPASYIAWRADHPAPRNRANSANKIQRVSRLQLARVADSSDEGEVERRAQRQTVLKDLLADPGRPSPLVPSTAMPSSSPPARGVSHASTAEQLPHRRTQSAEQQQTPPQVPVRQTGGFPSTPPTVEAKRPRYFERRDSSASARAEAERTRVWLPSAAGMESETS